MITKKAHWLKIRIVAEGKRIWIPSLPLWVIKAGTGIALTVLKKKERDQGDKTSVISAGEMRMIINELASYGKFVLVDVEVKADNTRVFIELK